MQPTEMYNGKPIVYSLGNFIFDGMEGAARQGQMVALPVTFTKTTGARNEESVALGQSASIAITINGAGLPRNQPINYFFGLPGGS